MRRSTEILVLFTLSTGHAHPYLYTVQSNYCVLLTETGRTEEEAQAAIDALVEHNPSAHALRRFAETRGGGCCRCELRSSCFHRPARPMLRHTRSRALGR
ncbi:MAG: hypothetical protein PVJ83_06165 [Gammaproteobacteria bacterium]|jgi:hypothetical protein